MRKQKSTNNKIEITRTVPALFLDCHILFSTLPDVLGGYNDLPTAHKHVKLIQATFDKLKQCELTPYQRERLDVMEHNLANYTTALTNIKTHYRYLTAITVGCITTIVGVVVLLLLLGK